MDKKKRLVSLISSEGKSVHQLLKEVTEAFEKFSNILADSQKRGSDNNG